MDGKSTDLATWQPNSNCKLPAVSRTNTACTTRTPAMATRHPNSCDLTTGWKVWQLRSRTSAKPWTNDLVIGKCPWIFSGKSAIAWRKNIFCFEYTYRHHWQVCILQASTWVNEMRNSETERKVTDTMLDPFLLTPSKHGMPWHSQPCISGCTALPGDQSLKSSDHPRSNGKIQRVFFIWWHCHPTILPCTCITFTD